MRIDCDGCRARGPACGECVVSVMLGPPEDVDLDGPTLVALANLADLGMVPHLRLVDGAGVSAATGRSEAARQASG